MPYIPKLDRISLDEEINMLQKGLLNLVNFDEARLPGPFNYAVSSLIEKTFLREGVSYAKINAAIGVLECIKLELYRKVAAPYEQKKESENGSVYENSNI